MSMCQILKCLDNCELRGLTQQYMDRQVKQRWADIFKLIQESGFEIGKYDERWTHLTSY